MTGSKHLYTPDSTAISVFSHIYLYYSNYYGNKLESLSSSGNEQLAVHQLKVFLFLLLLYVYFLLCLNNVQYVIYENSANKQRIEPPQGNQSLISHFLASLGAQEQPDAHIALILHINVGIN